MEREENSKEKRLHRQISGAKRQQEWREDEAVRKDEPRTSLVCQAQNVGCRQQRVRTADSKVWE